VALSGTSIGRDDVCAVTAQLVVRRDVPSLDAEEGVVVNKLGEWANATVPE
jgi:hypothetical protein